MTSGHGLIPHIGEKELEYTWVNSISVRRVNRSTDSDALYKYVTVIKIILFRLNIIYVYSKIKTVKGNLTCCK